MNELPYAYNPQIHNPLELFDKKPITPALDIYAFGYLLWGCLCRLQLEWALGKISISQIKNGVRPVVPESWPKELRLLLAATWSNQPEHRPSANQLLQQFTAMQANKTGDYIDTDCFDQVVTRAESNFNDAASLNSFESSDDEYDRPVLHGRNDIFRREPRPGQPFTARSKKDELPVCLILKRFGYILKLKLITSHRLGKKISLVSEASIGF